MSAAQHNKPIQPPARREPPVELIDLFLKNQSKELDIKAKELELHKQNDNHSFEFAKASLTAETGDREATRQHTLRTRKAILNFVLIFVIIFILFLCFALYLNKDAIALEVIKAVIYLVSGGGGGYAIARSANKPEPQKDE